MESNESRKCSVCHQTKLARHFPKTTRSTGMLTQAHICLLCQAALAQGDSGDEGGSGGKQDQHGRDAKHQQRAIELESIAQKNLGDLATKKQNTGLFQASQEREGERKIQLTQREWLDQKEQEAKTPQEKNEPNAEVSLETAKKKKGIVHLFSVTRSLALNRMTAHNKEVAAQKNFGLFAKTHEQKSTSPPAKPVDIKSDKQKAAEPTATEEDEEILATTDKMALTTESSTLFAHANATKSTAENTEKLANAIQEGQKIFRW